MNKHLSEDEIALFALEPTAGETQEHLRTCEGCSELLVKHESVLARLDAWEAPAPPLVIPPRVTALVEERIINVVPKRRRTDRAALGLAIVAASLVVVFQLLALLHGQVPDSFWERIPGSTYVADFGGTFLLTLAFFVVGGTLMTLLSAPILLTRRRPGMAWQQNS